jgi:hypothetical protein
VSPLVLLFERPGVLIDGRHVAEEGLLRHQVGELLGMVLVIVGEVQLFLEESPYDVQRLASSADVVKQTACQPSEMPRELPRSAPWRAI